MARAPHADNTGAQDPRPRATSVRSLSGTQRLGVAGLQAVLRRYISPILLDSVLNRAVEHHVSESLPPGDLLKVVTADCMIGLRLFVKPELLPQLMLELAELLEQD